MRIFGKGGSARDGVTAGDIARPPQVELRTVGGRLSQVVETRPDGTKTVGTFTYVADVPTGITFTNPDRVVTFPTSSGQPAGWAGA